MLQPASHVQGVVQPRQTMPGIPAQRMPGARYHIATGSETLYGLAQELYGNPRRAVDIYNANRSGTIRSDRAMGFIDSLDAPLPVGALVLIP